MAFDNRRSTGSLLATLTMLGGLGVFGLGMLLLALYVVGNDPDVRRYAVYAIFAGAFIEVAVIARAIVIRSERNFPKRAR